MRYYITLLYTVEWNNNNNNNNDDDDDDNDNSNVKPNDHKLRVPVIHTGKHKFVYNVF